MGQVHYLLCLSRRGTWGSEGRGSWMVSVAAARCPAHLGSNTIVTFRLESASTLACGSLTCAPPTCKNLRMSELRRLNRSLNQKRKLAAQLQPKLGSFGTSRMRLKKFYECGSWVGRLEEVDLSSFAGIAFSFYFSSVIFMHCISLCVHRESLGGGCGRTECIGCLCVAEIGG